MAVESGGSPQHSASSGGSETSAASGGGDINFQELFESTQKELGDAREHGSKLEQRLKLVGHQSEQTSQVLERIKASLMGEESEGAKVSPIDAKIQDLQGQMDQYIEAAIKADREGRPIPLTANLAVQSLKFQIEALQEREADRKQIAELQARIQQQSDPAAQINNIAYSNIDSHLVSALATIYGPEEDTSPQFNAISSQIIKEIKDLQKTDPQTWDRVRRDRSAQAKLVNHFVEKSIPPRARQMMSEDRIRREPIGANELLNAFREAKDLASNGDPNAKEYVQKIREELLGRLVQKSAPNMGRSSRFE